MKKKKYKTKAKAGKAMEPKTNYGMNMKTNIHFFSSSEDMEEDNYKWLATLSPEEHLRNAVANIKRIFAEDLRRNPRIGNKLYFD